MFLTLIKKLFPPQSKLYKLFQKVRNKEHAIALNKRHLSIIYKNFHLGEVTSGFTQESVWSSIYQTKSGFGLGIFAT